MINEDLYMGLDCSLNNSGIVVFGKTTGYLYESIKPKCKGYERLAYIHDSLTKILAKYPNIKGANIERYAYNKGGNDKSNAGMVFNIGEGGGVVRLALFSAGIPVLLTSPNTGKKYATGKGVGGKEIILKEVYKRFGEDLDDDNLADALVMARIAYHWFTDDYEGLTKAQIEAVKAASLEHEPPKPTSRRKRRVKRK